MPLTIYCHLSSQRQEIPLLEIAKMSSRSSEIITHGPSGREQKQPENIDQEDIGEQDNDQPLIVRSGRPDLPAHIRAATRETLTLGIATCGPTELVYDVRQAVAEEQLKIARGTAVCRECYLHTEVFGW